MEITGEKVGRWNYLESKMRSRLLEDQVQLLTDCPSHAVKTLKRVSLASLISICVGGKAEGRRHDRGWRGFSVLLKDWGSTIQVVHTWIAVQCFYHACGRSRSTGNPKYWTCLFHRLSPSRCSTHYIYVLTHSRDTLVCNDKAGNVSSSLERHRRDRYIRGKSKNIQRINNDIRGCRGKGSPSSVLCSFRELEKPLTEWNASGQQPATFHLIPRVVLASLVHVWESINSASEHLYTF